jgi:hypothetical protein
MFHAAYMAELVEMNIDQEIEDEIEDEISRLD